MNQGATSKGPDTDTAQEKLSMLRIYGAAKSAESLLNASLQDTQHRSHTHTQDRTSSPSRDLHSSPIWKGIITIHSLNPAPGASLSVAKVVSEAWTCW